MCGNHPVTFRGFVCPLLNVRVVPQGHHGGLCPSPPELASQKAAYYGSVLHVVPPLKLLFCTMLDWRPPQCVRIVTFEPLLPASLPRLFFQPEFPCLMITLPISHNPPMCYIAECVVGEEGMYTSIFSMPLVHGQISEGSLPSIDLLALRCIVQLRSAGLKGVSCV